MLELNHLLIFPDVAVEDSISLDCRARIDADRSRLGVDDDQRKRQSKYANDEEDDDDVEFHALIIGLIRSDAHCFLHGQAFQLLSPPAPGSLWALKPDPMKRLDHLDACFHLAWFSCDFLTHIPSPDASDDRVV